MFIVSEEVITEDEHDEENEHLEFGIDRSKQGSSFTAFFRQVYKKLLYKLWCFLQII